MKYKLKQVTTVTPVPTVRLPDGAMIVSATSERMLYPPITDNKRRRVIQSWTIYYLEPIIKEEEKSLEWNKIDILLLLAEYNLFNLLWGILNLEPLPDYETDSKFEGEL